MRRIAPALAVFFVWAAPAHAKPIVSVQASATLGAAPLTVTLTASGDAATYHWDLGDGSAADGPVVQHQFGPGPVHRDGDRDRLRRRDRPGERRHHVRPAHAQRPEGRHLRTPHDLPGTDDPGSQRRSDHALFRRRACAHDQAGQEGALRRPRAPERSDRPTAPASRRSRRTRSRSPFAPGWTWPCPARECSAGRSSCAPFSGRGARERCTCASGGRATSCPRRTSAAARSST